MMSVRMFTQLENTIQIYLGRENKETETHSLRQRDHLKGIYCSNVMKLNEFNYNFLNMDYLLAVY